MRHEVAQEKKSTIDPSHQPMLRTLVMAGNTKPATLLSNLTIN